MVVKVEERINKIWVWDPLAGALQVDPLEYCFVERTSPEVAMRVLKRMDLPRQRPENNIYTV